MTTKARVQKLERELKSRGQIVRARSHRQLVVLTTYAREHGHLPDDWDAVAGPPEAILEPGQKSHAELICETLLRWRLKLAAAVPSCR